MEEKNNAAAEAVALELNPVPPGVEQPWEGEEEAAWGPVDEDEEEEEKEEDEGEEEEDELDPHLAAGLHPQDPAADPIAHVEEAQHLPHAWANIFHRDLLGGNVPGQISVPFDQATVENLPPNGFASFHNAVRVTVRPTLAGADSAVVCGDLVDIGGTSSEAIWKIYGRLDLSVINNRCKLVVHVNGEPRYLCQEGVKHIIVATVFYRRVEFTVRLVLSCVACCWFEG